ncbi:MAG: TlpA disulfide reductase family protein [Solirubrobacteraceae bacterium]
MGPRRLLAILAGLAVAALIAIGLTQLPGSSRTSAGGHEQAPLQEVQQDALLAGSPPALAALHRQGGRLLSGGSAALHAELAALHGYPVVINKWASWCVPCRAEFGAFARVAAEYGRRVAFIGLDSGDSSRGDALGFLAGHPVSYPSYYDSSGALGLALTDSSFTPVTVFIPVHGQPFIYQGELPSAQKLEEDLIRYALHA